MGDLQGTVRTERSDKTRGGHDHVPKPSHWVPSLFGRKSIASTTRVGSRCDVCEDFWVLILSKHKYVAVSMGKGSSQGELDYNSGSEP